MSQDRFNFRAWCEKFKVYAPINGGFSIPGEPYNIAFDPVHISADGRLYEVNNYDGKEVCQVDDVTECYTIEQCTGLKDKNGKLIYEGDIVIGTWNTKLVVLWDEISAGYRVKPLDGGSDREFHYFSSSRYLDDGTISYCHFEIIGNIHEMEVAK